MADGYLNFDTKINTSGFSGGLKSLTGLADRLIGTFAKVGTAVAAAFSTRQIVEYAADVKALNSQFEQTFGSLQGEAQAAINKVSKSSQILDTRLKSTAASIYAFAKANGMDSQTALSMMGDALEVTADSAAYYDRSLEETGETLKSFLKGNYANDAALGISCTETTRNIAANKLYGQSFKDLSEAQKQLVLLQMVKDANAASGALGQAAREAEGWENVIGNLKEAWKQLLAVIGQPILAAIVPVIKNITSALQKLTTIAQAAANAIAAVFGLELKTADSTSEISDNLSDITDTSGLDELSDGLDEIGDKARQVEREVDLDGARAAMSAVSDTSAAIAAGAENAGDSYDEMADAAKKAEKANKGSLASFDKINKLGGDNDNDNAAADNADAERARRVAAQAAEIEEVFRKINNLRKIYDTSEEEALKQKEDYLDRLRASGALLEENDKRYSADFEDDRADIIAAQREEYYRQLQEQYDEEYAAQKKAAEQAKKLAEENKSADAAKKPSNAAIELVDKLSGKSSLEKKLTGIISSVKALLEKIFEPLESAWDKYGQGAVDSMERAFANVWELVKSIGKSFIEVWTNGTGEEMVGHILGIFTQVNTYIANLAENFRKAWSADNIGTDIIQHAADIFNTILSHIENIAAAWAEWAGEVNFSPLLTAFDKLEQAVKPIVDDLGEWFEDINSDILIPLSTWTVETLIPTVLDSIAKALEGLHAAWETAYPVVKEKLWDKFLLPLAKWAGEKSVQLIKEFGDAIKEWGENLTEKDVEVFIDLAKTIGAIITAVKGAGILSAFSTALGKLAGAFAPAAASIGTGIGAVITDVALPVIAGAIAGLGIGTMIRDAIGGDKIDEALFPIFDAIVGFFTETIPGWWQSFSEDTLFPIGEKIGAVCDEIGEMFSAAWGAITAVWDNFEPYFLAIGDFFVGIFTSAWETIKAVWETAVEFFSILWENIKAVFEVVGDVIGGFFVTAWENIKVAWNVAGDFFGTIWENIKLSFNAVEEFFRGNFEVAWEKVKEIWNNTTEFFGSIWEGIKGVFFNVTDYLSNIFTSAWNAVSTIFSLKTVVNFFTSVVNKIKSVIGKIIGIVRDTFKSAWSHVTSIFSLDNAKTLFSNIAVKMAEGFSYIVSLIKSPINGVIDVFNFLMDAISSGFNAVTGVIEDLVNSVADTVNALSFDIPDWAGGGTLGFDMPHVSIPDISIPHLPRLATGTVVPANYGEFAAVLGDNKRETEVVSPLSTIKQALIQALRENGSDSGDIYIYLDGEELSYSLERRAGRRSKRTGGA